MLLNIKLTAIWLCSGLFTVVTSALGYILLELSRKLQGLIPAKTISFLICCRLVCWRCLKTRLSSETSRTLVDQHWKSLIKITARTEVLFNNNRAFEPYIRRSHKRYATHAGANVSCTRQCIWSGSFGDSAWHGRFYGHQMDQYFFVFLIHYSEVWALWDPLMMERLLPCKLFSVSKSESLRGTFPIWVRIWAI